MTGESRQVRRLLALLDPWLSRAALVVELRDRATRERKIRDDEVDARGTTRQHGARLSVRHDSSRLRPTPRPGTERHLAEFTHLLFERGPEQLEQLADIFHNTRRLYRLIDRLIDGL
jgi:hypothetical protein